MIFPEFAIFFLLAVLLPFRMALHRSKNLKKAAEKKQFFFGKYTKEKSEICYDEKEECTLNHLTKSGTERFWEYTIRSGGGFFMIRENNTLEWQETAEQKE